MRHGLCKYTLIDHINTFQIAICKQFIGNENMHAQNKKCIGMQHIVILQRGVLGKVEQYYVKKEYQMRGAPHYHILLWIEIATVVRIDCPVLSYKTG